MLWDAGYDSYSISQCVTVLLRYFKLSVMVYVVTASLHEFPLVVGLGDNVVEMYTSSVSRL